MATSSGGHAFISYVREDSDRVDRLQRILEAAGVPVWRDTEDLWPGEDWRSRIRRAITKNSLAFIACFSHNSEARSVSGMNEEIMLAVEQLRLRRPDQPWLIPVRFDDVSIPDLDIGGGRTLNAIQRADLIDQSWDQGSARLVAGVLRALGGSDADGSGALSTSTSLRIQLKDALRDPKADIALHDMMIPIADQVRVAISDDEAFPSSSEALSGAASDAALYMVSLVDEYMAVLAQALETLQLAAQWVGEDQLGILTRFVERTAPTNADDAGMVVLTSLRWFPLTPVLFVGALAAVHRQNYAALRAIAIDAMVRDRTDGRVPVIARGNPWRPFSRFELVPQVLAVRASGEEPTRDLVEELRTKRKGNRYTPVSDYLHDVLRPLFQEEVPNDEDFAELFDHVEVLLALLMIDAKLQLGEARTYFDRPFYGRFTWRDRYARPEDYLESRMLRELSNHGSQWPPLAGGLFGGSVDRATAAFEAFVEGAGEARQGRW